MKLPQLPFILCLGIVLLLQSCLISRQPQEDLYDLTNAPFEIHNLAKKPEQKDHLIRLRRLLTAWENESGDRGRQLEPEASYDSEMAAYLAEIRPHEPELAISIEKNIALMKQWRAAGK